MKNTDKHKRKKTIQEPVYTADKTLSDDDADKTGTDTSADKTETADTKKGGNKNRFDKPKREPNPDKTGIDTDSDKTKKESEPIKQSTKTVTQATTPAKTNTSK